MGKRLLLLTLTLENALREESWAESDTLFRERGKLLDKMERLNVRLPNDLYDEVLSVERRAMQALGKIRSSIVDQQKENLVETRAFTAYIPSGTPNLGFDAVS